MNEIKKPNLQVWPVSRLVPYDKNVKIHDKKQVKVIVESIREFGWHGAIMVDVDGSIIAGHGRRLALIELGVENVPVWVRDDLTPEQVRALRLVDNKAGEGGIDTEMFREELADLDFDMKGFFSDKELDFAVADLGTVNLDAFTADVNGAVDAQEVQMRTTAAEVAVKAVPVAKVLGFKEISGANQLKISRFIADIEHKFNCKGEAALAALADSFLESK